MPIRLRTKDLQTLTRGVGLAGICFLNGKGFPQKNRSYERIAPTQSGKNEIEVLELIISRILHLASSTGTCLSYQVSCNKCLQAA